MQKNTIQRILNKIGFNQLSEIIAYSRIVGMHAPGLNSIFSELNFLKIALILKILILRLYQLMNDLIL